LELFKEFAFEAAHRLPNVPSDHKCSRLHGHSYRLDVAVEGPLRSEGPAAGMIEDFDALGRTVKETVIAALDHRSLNDLIENPTAERITVWIWGRLSPVLPGLAELVLWETATACAVMKKGDPLNATA